MKGCTSPLNFCQYGSSLIDSLKYTSTAYYLDDDIESRTSPGGSGSGEFARRFKIVGIWRWQKPIDLIRIKRRELDIESSMSLAKLSALKRRDETKYLTIDKC